MGNQWFGSHWNKNDKATDSLVWLYFPPLKMKQILSHMEVNTPLWGISI